jgi:hypothetical protein
LKSEDTETNSFKVMLSVWASPALPGSPLEIWFSEDYKALIAFTLEGLPLTVSAGE